MARDGLEDQGHVEPRQEHRRTARDDASGDDGQAAHVRQRHAAQPAVVATPAEVVRARGSAGQERRARQGRRLRVTRGARGGHEGEDVRAGRRIVQRRRRRAAHVRECRRGLPCGQGGHVGLGHLRHGRRSGQRLGRLGVAQACVDGEPGGARAARAPGRTMTLSTRDTARNATRCPAARRRNAALQQPGHARRERAEARRPRRDQGRRPASLALRPPRCPAVHRAVRCVAVKAPCPRRRRLASRR